MQDKLIRAQSVLDLRKVLKKENTQTQGIINSIQKSQYKLQLKKLQRLHS